MLVIENQRSDWLASVVSEKLRLSFSHLRLLTNLSFLRMIDCTKLANALQWRTTQEISRKISCGYVQKHFKWSSALLFNTWILDEFNSQINFQSIFNLVNEKNLFLFSAKIFHDPTEWSSERRLGYGWE